MDDAIKESKGIANEEKKRDGPMQVALAAITKLTLKRKAVVIWQNKYAVKCFYHVLNCHRPKSEPKIP